jgi:hypothetical protein
MRFPGESQIDALARVLRRRSSNPRSDILVISPGGQGRLTSSRATAAKIMAGLEAAARKANGNRQH